MSKTIIIPIVILGIVGVLFAYTQDYIKKPTMTDETKNVEIMQNDAVSETKIIIQDDVEYFPNVQGYFVKPEAIGEYPGVIMIHENRGLRPEIREAADMLAKEGYMVLAVNLLGGVADDQDGARALTAQFNQTEGIANMRAGVEYLRAQGATKLASLGWCFGGRQSVELAISGEKLDATVVYYGGRMATSTDRLAPISWPVLGIFGETDQSIPPEMVDAFKTSLETLGVKNEIYVYPGVGHAFANPSGANYAPDETKDAWSKTLTFLSQNLKRQ